MAGRNGKEMRAAVEEIRPALPESALAAAVQESMDVLDNSLNDAISDSISDCTHPPLFDNP